MDGTRSPSSLGLSRKDLDGLASGFQLAVLAIEAGWLSDHLQEFSRTALMPACLAALTQSVDTHSQDDHNADGHSLHVDRKA